MQYGLPDMVHGPCDTAAHTVLQVLPYHLNGMRAARMALTICHMHAGHRRMHPEAPTPLVPFNLAHIGQYVSRECAGLLAVA